MLCYPSIQFSDAIQYASQVEMEDAEEGVLRWRRCQSNERFDVVCIHIIRSCCASILYYNLNIYFLFWRITTPRMEVKDVLMLFRLLHNLLQKSAKQNRVNFDNLGTTCTPADFICCICKLQVSYLFRHLACHLTIPIPGLEADVSLSPTPTATAAAGTGIHTCI